MNHERRQSQKLVRNASASVPVKGPDMGVWGGGAPTNRPNALAAHTVLSRRLGVGAVTGSVTPHVQ